MLLSALACICVLSAEPSSWPQFRGAAFGVAEDAKYPDSLDPDKNLVWKAVVPPGHSSPIIHGDRIYLTGVRERKRLFTLCLSADDGNILWGKEATYKTAERIHRIGSLAQPTPVTDGERVISFFGSFGLLCYSKDGELLWKLPMGPFDDDFGTGASPVLVGNYVILCRDQDTGSFLMAVDKKTGKTIWKTDRSEFPRGYATPAVWTVNGSKQIVVCGTLRVIGYDLQTGKEIWTVRGFARIANHTPSVSEANLYVSAWAPGGDIGERISVPSYVEFLKLNDKNANRKLEIKEIKTSSAIRNRFRQIDRNKDDHITSAEYESMRAIFDKAQNVIMTIKPGGVGDITESHVVWRYHKILPYVASPIFYSSRLFMVKNSGIVSCLDAATGLPTKQGRILARSNIYSSPVAADGKVYMISERGEVNVIRAAAQWSAISHTKLGERCYATPALSGGRVYVRTEKALYCFGIIE